MLLMVLLPATKAPNPPMRGAKKGQASLARKATPLAKTRGIFS